VTWGRSAFVVFVFGASALHAERALALCDQPTDPDCIHKLQSFTGTIDFFATGASFAVSDPATADDPSFVVDVASVDVPERRIPPRAQLLKAYLYFGGSHFMDHPTPPSMMVEIKLPGANTFVPVTADQLYKTGPLTGFPEVFLYASRADITDLMKQNAGPLTGTYSVRGFDTNIFYRGGKHTIANANFSIVLIFEEQRLPPREIVIFDGSQEVYGSTVALDLSGFLVSLQPSGTLTFYAQEGDCNPEEDCPHGNDRAGLEQVHVIGQSPDHQLVLTDDVNPPNDIFNRTINTVDPPLRNIVGTDIDTFDISSVMRAGDTHLHVDVTSPLSHVGLDGDLINLVYVIVGIDVFAPELRIDSRVQIRAANGQKLDAYNPGDPLRVAYTLSNTGNLRGTGVALTADVPNNVTSFQVMDQPPGVMVTTDPKGGAFGKGRIMMTNASVRNGEETALVVEMVTNCPLDMPEAFVATATVGAPVEGGSMFAMTSSTTLVARSRCGPSFFLYGGGGCREVNEPKGRSLLWPMIGLAFIAVLVGRRIRRRT
jgi:hypothetical protein